MTKYYKVIKENFLWEVGGIVSCDEHKDEGYTPIDDIFKKHEGNEYITPHIVEDSPEYFERVYKVDLISRAVYKTKEQAKAMIAKDYKAKK